MLDDLVILPEEEVPVPVLMVEEEPELLDGTTAAASEAIPLDGELAL